MSARRWRIRGLVQGVGFRAFALHAARSAGVAAGVGGVRNEPDGAVTVVAGGAPETLDRFGSELARGPRFARVAGVESEDFAEPPSGERYDLGF